MLQGMVRSRVVPGFLVKLLDGQAQDLLTPLHEGGGVQSAQDNRQV